MRPEHLLNLFQSHAGSIEARRRLKEAIQNIEVSIPRWFD